MQHKYIDEISAFEEAKRAGLSQAVQATTYYDMCKNFEAQCDERNDVVQHVDSSCQDLQAQLADSHQSVSTGQAQLDHLYTEGNKYYEETVVPANQYRTAERFLQQVGDWNTRLHTEVTSMKGTAQSSDTPGIEDLKARTASLESNAAVLRAIIIIERDKEIERLTITTKNVSSVGANCVQPSVYTAFQERATSVAGQPRDRVNERDDNIKLLNRQLMEKDNQIEKLTYEIYLVEQGEEEEDADPGVCESKGEDPDGPQSLDKLLDVLGPKTGDAVLKKPQKQRVRGAHKSERRRRPITL